MKLSTCIAREVNRKSPKYKIGQTVFHINSDYRSGEVEIEEHEINQIKLTFVFTENYPLGFPEFSYTYETLGYRTFRDNSKLYPSYEDAYLELKRQFDEEKKIKELRKESLELDKEINKLQEELSNEN